MHREERGCWAWPGPKGRGGRVGRRVSEVLALVTPSCLGDRQLCAAGASRWQGGRRGMFAQPRTPAKGDLEEGGSWSRAGGWHGGGRRRAREGLLWGCLFAGLDLDNRESINFRPAAPPAHRLFRLQEGGMFAQRQGLAVGPSFSRTLYLSLYPVLAG